MAVVFPSTRRWLRKPLSRSGQKEIMSGKIEVNQEELAKVFTEWERRYREEPERFQSEAVKLLRETPESYGEAAAPYFVFILNEMRPNGLRAADASPQSPLKNES